MPKEIDPMLAEALKAARGVEPARDIPADAKRRRKNMSADEAAKAIRAWIFRESGVEQRLSGSMLTKIENGVEPASELIVRAAASVYTKAGNRLTKFYQKSAESDTISSASYDPLAIVPKTYLLGGTSGPWLATAAGRGNTYVHKFMEAKEFVQLQRNLGNLPAGCLVMFEPDSFLHEDTWLLLASRSNPDVRSIRYVAPTDPTVFLSTEDEERLPVADWKVIGWMAAWAQRKGHDFPDWHLVRKGIGPAFQR